MENNFMYCNSKQTYFRGNKASSIDMIGSKYLHTKTCVKSDIYQNIAIIILLKFYNLTLSPGFCKYPSTYSCSKNSGN
ncbi:hypothetical protein KUTeg_003661 [Tegillarca granosa]|uniref:Uncharacterized protein n=1 Tax=Tegillarca granosa TaxID=220873 RepID=A0ABQ9FS67_TEGGR|nr:hypothetical protein KUTeg_003661 [Tegillarca granosa]